MSRVEISSPMYSTSSRRYSNEPLLVHHKPPAGKYDAYKYRNTSSTTTTPLNYNSPSYRTSGYTSNTLPGRLMTRERPLPSGPGPLDTSGKPLTSSFRVNDHRGNSPTGRGPVKGDHSIGSLGNSNSNSGRSSPSSYIYKTAGRKHLNYNNAYNLTNDMSSLALARKKSSSLLNLSSHNLNDNSPVEKNFQRSRYSEERVSNYPETGSLSRRSSVTQRRESIDGLSRPLSRSLRNQSIERTYELSNERRSSQRSPERNSPMVDSDSSVRQRRFESQDTESRKSPASVSSGKYSESGKVGLRNLGNTCFMNSVLQSLSNTKPLLEYCLNEDYRCELNHTSSTMKGHVMQAFAKLLLSMWKDKNEMYVSPNSFKTEIQKYAPRFMGYAQQDAQEFLRYLMQGLHEDVNLVQRKPKQVTISDDVLDKMSDTDKANHFWDNYLQFDRSSIVDMFVGQLKSELRFDNCNHRSVTFDPFWDLSLPIPKRTGEVSLQDCLSLFMKEESLEGDERPMCTQCKSRRACRKRFSIQKCPRILVLHLKRFSQEMYRRRLSTEVHFPLSLDMSEFITNKDKPAGIYNLYAVCNHSGSTHFGHYTAYAKHPYSGEWNSFNDIRTNPIRSGQLVSSEAYVLFYELAGRSTSRL